MAAPSQRPPPPPPPPPPPLVKSKSWSPETLLEESWQRRKDLHRERRRSGGAACRSVTEEDLDELRGFIDLGFDFGSCGAESPKLCETLPALDLFYALRRGVEVCSPQHSSSSPSSPSSTTSSPLRLYSPGDNPKEVKKRLKQWAQLVACSVREQY